MKMVKVITSVLRSGPPLVMIYTEVNTWNALMMVMTVTNTRVFRSMGMVI